MVSCEKIVVLHVAKYLDGNDRLCNHNCLFCMERMEPDDSNELLPSIETIDKLLFDYVHNNGRITKLFIAGGEPTLRNDFFEVLKVVKKYTDNVVLSSCCDYENEDKMIDLIVKSRIKSVATSIHGTESIHDYLTGSSGSFERTMSAVRKLLSLGVEVSVNSVICSANVRDMLSIAEEINALSISKLTFTHYINHGNAYYHDNLKFDVNEFSDSFSELINHLKNFNFPVTFRDFPFCIDYRIRYFQERVDDYYIIDLCEINKVKLKCEKAPLLVKEKCNYCNYFSDCPKYLLANYGEKYI